MPGYILRLVIGLIGVSLVIIVHEFGHFVASRLMGIDVEVLSFGMGPKVFSYRGNRTEYRFSLIPFGGFCRMKGSLDIMKALRDNEGTLNSVEEGSFFAANPVKKFIVYLSGPVINILLAFILFAISASISVERLSDPAIVAPLTSYPTLFPGNPHTQNSIEKGDLILSSAEREFIDWQDFKDYISHLNEPIEITVERLNDSIKCTITPEDGVYGIAKLQKPVIGRSESDLFEEGDIIISANGEKIEYDLDLYAIPGDAMDITVLRGDDFITVESVGRDFPFAWKSDLRKAPDSEHPFKYSLKKTADSFLSAFKAISSFITFHLEDSLAVLTGPTKAAENIGNITILSFKVSAESGIRSFLNFLAIVSVSLSVANILPIPSFDGGQMVVCVAEKIMGRPARAKTYVLLSILGILATFIIMIMLYSLDIRAYFFS